MFSPSFTTPALFALTYLGLALGDLPALKLDRSWVALAGAAAMLVAGDLSMRQASQGLDYPTLLLLFGMMILVGALRAGGFFEEIGHRAMLRIRSPRQLLGLTVLVSGFLSAFLVNDVVCLALAPLVVHLARKLRADPLPHLMALATSANIGSVATIVGNPQNMIIGSYSGISYLRFAARLAPLAVVALLVDYAVLSWAYSGLLRAAEGNSAFLGRAGSPSLEDKPRTADRALLVKALGLTVLTVVLFLAGLPQHWVALGAAAALFFQTPWGAGWPRGVLRHLDWKLLLLFTGLFVVVHGFELRVMSRWDVGGWKVLFEHPIPALSALSAALSNLVSNVPAVLIFKPIVPHLPPTSRTAAWLALAMASTLAGNFTVLGSVANLIVIEGARREGVVISFRDYFRVGAPLTVLTLALGIVYLTYFKL